MKVICALCDTKKDLKDKSLLAKKLQKNPTKIFICDTCYNRISDKRSKRIAERKNND